MAQHRDHTLAHSSPNALQSCLPGWSEFDGPQHSCEASRAFPSHPDAFRGLQSRKPKRRMESKRPGLPFGCEDDSPRSSGGQADPEAPLDCLSSLDTELEDCGKSKIACPRQSTLGFWNTEDGLYHLIRVCCKTWSCPYCGRIKRAQLESDIASARPNRFLTLTTCGASNETPRQIFDWTRRQISELAKEYRRCDIEFEYLRALEATKLGFPHYHLLVRSPYLDQKELSHRWCHLTRAYIVDIRALTKDERAAKYVMKYLTKAGTVPFTNRRLSWTRKFFPKQPEHEGPPCVPVDIERWQQPMESVVWWEFPGCAWEKLNRWHWIRKGTS